MTLSELSEFVFKRTLDTKVQISAETLKRVQNSHEKLKTVMEQGIPLYGVTTGFGDSCFRLIGADQSAELQKNLVSYLLCGSGENISVEASRAMFAIRLKSLCQGHSGVSVELVERMRLFLEKDWIPVVPREGSLGASGDLIPLAYLAQVIQGEGTVFSQGQICQTKDLLKAAGLSEYRLKPKEGLALVNGTSTMAGMFLHNLQQIKFLVELSCQTTAWLTLALRGRTECFESLVNEKANRHPGQALAAKMIRGFLQAESYQSKPLREIQISASQTQEFIQDRYSLRCAPQILGPIFETITQAETWLEDEVNGAADNPLLGDEGSIAMGGNFYGGYLSHGMDYLKICLGHLADLVDRQLVALVDEKSNRGLPPNLANWPGLPEEERFLHHGLKGLHQAVGALTSEVMARAIPNGIFSRSSESHNQDKVSLGMSAAVQCAQMVEPLFTMSSAYLICLAQALDLRGVKPVGASSQKLYERIRTLVPFVKKDTALGNGLRELSLNLKSHALADGKASLNL